MLTTENLNALRDLHDQVLSLQGFFFIPVQFFHVVLTDRLVIYILVEYC